MPVGTNVCTRLCQFKLYKFWPLVKPCLVCAMSVHFNEQFNAFPCSLSSSHFLQQLWLCGEDWWKAGIIWNFLSVYYTLWPKVCGHLIIIHFSKSKGPSPNPEKQPLLIIPPNSTVGTMNSFISFSPGIQQTHSSQRLALPIVILGLWCCCWKPISWSSSYSFWADISSSSGLEPKWFWLMQQRIPTVVNSPTLWVWVVCSFITELYWLLKRFHFTMLALTFG